MTRFTEQLLVRAFVAATAALLMCFTVAVDMRDDMPRVVTVPDEHEAAAP